MHEKTLPDYCAQLIFIDRLQFVTTTLLFIVVWVSFLICIGPMLSIVATLAAAAAIAYRIPRHSKGAKK